MSNPIDRSSQADALELQRVSRLHELQVLDTAAEPLFDALTQAAALLTGAPIALISLVDADRQWFKSNIGLDGIKQTPRDVAFCAHTILGDAVLEIPDATRDARFADNPLVRNAPDLRFYAGAPIVLSDGLRMGSLCVIDRVPRTLTVLQAQVLQKLAAAASEALEQRRLALQHTASLKRALDSSREEDGSPESTVGTRIDVTARKDVERRMHASEVALERTARLASIGGWEVDLANGDIHWSDEMCRIHEVPTGYRPTLEEGIAFYAEDVRAPLAAVVQKAIADGQGWDLELPLVTAKGRALWVRTFGTVEFEEGKARWLVGAMQDVTLRRGAVEALEKSERRFRKLFEGSLGLICRHDMTGVLVSVNPAAAASLGYSVQEMTGHRLSHFMRATDGWIMDAYLERIVANGVDIGMLRLLNRDGELRVWEYRNVVDDDGQAYVLGYAQDVTDRERNQHELQERSVRDPLTGCRNRAYLAELADRWRPDDPFACIAIDLDRFKQVNDTFGHHRGDEVLVQMGQFLARFLRPEDVVVRVGGDEFLALLMGADDVVARNVTRRLLENKDAAPIGFTLGSAVRRPRQTLDEVWAEADRKLYESRARRV